MLAFSEEVHALLAAHYPFLWFTTWEEGRVVHLLRQLCRVTQRPVEMWAPDAYSDPGAALDEVLTACASRTDPFVVILSDAHPYLNEASRTRRLRTLQDHLEVHGATLVFVSPVVVIPPELARDWTVVDVPLPDRIEMTTIAEAALPPEDFPAVNHERVAIAALGLTGREARRAFLRARHQAGLARRRGQPFDWAASVHGEKRRLLTQGGAVTLWQPEETMGDVGGLDELKGWIDERKQAFEPEARAFGLPQPKGLLLLGVQGCGKSLAAKAVANDWGLPLLRLDMSSLFLSELAPDTGLRDALRTAEAMAPSVLWVDELEKGIDAGGSADSTRLLGSLLTWLQEQRSGVFFVATANRVDRLPPELLRRGRFDEIFFVDLPDRHARQAILEIQLRRHGQEPSHFDLEDLAERCSHFSGAELEQVIISALYACYAQRSELSQRDLQVAVNLMVPLYRLYETEIKALRTWSEGRARPAARSRRLRDYFHVHPTGEP